MKSLFLIIILSLGTLSANTIQPTTSVSYSNGQFKDGVLSIDVAYGGCNKLSFNLDLLPELMAFPYDPNKPQRLFLSHSGFAGYCRMHIFHTLTFDLSKEYGVGDGSLFEVLASAGNGKAEVVFSTSKEEQELPESLIPVGICTMDINAWGNPSACSCPELYEYNSQSGLCHIK